MAKLTETQKRVFEAIQKTKGQSISIKTTPQSVFSSMLKPRKLVNGTRVGAKDWKVGDQMFIYYADGSGVFTAREGSYQLSGSIRNVKVNKDGYITSIK